VKCGIGARAHGSKGRRNDLHACTHHVISVAAEAARIEAEAKAAEAAAAAAAAEALKKKDSGDDSMDGQRGARGNRRRAAAASAAKALAAEAAASSSSFAATQAVGHRPTTRSSRSGRTSCRERGAWKEHVAQGGRETRGREWASDR